MKTKIYFLRDETGFVRYVGKTQCRLHKRLSAHLQRARRGCVSHKDSWLRNMLSKGFIPKIDLITEVNGDGCTVEQKYISYLRSHGVPLVNATDGGDGLINPSIETRIKMGRSQLGRKHSEETKRKIGDKILGIRRSTETRKLMSLSLMGRVCSSETRRKISNSCIGRIPWNKNKRTCGTYKLAQTKQRRLFQ